MTGVQTCALPISGTLRFDGRLKEVIKTAGVNVAAAEVEACLASATGVAAAYVVPVPHEVRGENVGAFLVPQGTANLDPEAVLAHCRREMASYKVPRHLFLLGTDGVPRTGTAQPWSGSARPKTGCRNQ